jgi:thioesterase domain-containing protein
VENTASTIDLKQQEVLLAEIWAELLDHKHIGPDENLFNLGAHPAIFSALQERIVQKFGRTITVAQFFQNPTVRSQVMLMHKAAKPDPAVPPGVLLLQRNESRPTIFWLHYMNVKLAKEVGEGQPVCLVMLTKADTALLGEGPSLRSIAACFMGKILAMQPCGPYHLAGLCIGGVLAYEVALQMRAAGHAVSLLVLLDAPSPAYLNSYNSLAAKLGRPRHLLGRMARLGLRESLSNLRRRLLKYAARAAVARYAWSQFGEAQALIEAASFEYKAEKYTGDVLLLLASKRTTSLDFLPGWQALIRHNLHTKFVEGHHRELMTAENVRSVAEIILSYLKPAIKKQEGLLA